MAITYVYTGKLADFTDTPFPEAAPRLWVEGEHESMSSDSVLAAKRVPVSVGGDGAFSVQLVASVDLEPFTRYELRCEWLDADTVIGWTSWKFTALIGGGPIAKMRDVTITNVWYSDGQPPVSRSGIYWISPSTGDVKEWV